jgi:hypothetical protein
MVGWKFSFAAVFMVGALGIAPASVAGDLRTAQPQLLAQSSCNAMQSLCARRCKERVPDDADCVSDHCTPKLKTCRQDGCWQEGQRYGGARTCGLRKT